MLAGAYSGQRTACQNKLVLHNSVDQSTFLSCSLTLIQDSKRRR